MAEIKREPLRIVVGEEEYAAFDADHTLSDIARWLVEQGADADEMAFLMRRCADG